MRVRFNHSPSSDDPDGDGLLQLPWRGINDITAHLDPLAAHSWPVEDKHLEKTLGNVRTDNIRDSPVFLTSAGQMFANTGVRSVCVAEGHFPSQVTLQLCSLTETFLRVFFFLLSKKIIRSKALQFETIIK